MDFMPFYTRYKDLAAKETRCITISRSGFGVPRGEYGLIEYYCTDSTCDCRKVMLNVTHSEPPYQVLATIGYGWESAEFYTKWMHGDAERGKQITGTYLEVWGTQSQYAQDFLELIEEIALTDEYIERIKTHYRLFKIYRASPSPSRSPQRKKRRSRSGSR